MKIGILTQPLHTNYGGMLQNYALQQVLIKAGHTVETIDWKINPFRRYMSNIKAHMLAWINPNKYSKALYQLNNRERAIIQSQTNRFINKYINHTNPVTSYNGFKEIAKNNNYDAYIVGSDQCWRPLYNCFIKAMFLDFTIGYNVKRIAYAASFGNDSWEYTNEQTIEFANLLKQFNLVSVREDSGVELCKNHLDVDAIHVLDPTMLLTRTDYVKIIENESIPASNGNLFTYILDPSSVKNNFINQVEKELGLKAFNVLPKYQAETRTKKNVKKEIEDCVFPSTTEWLRAFLDAEMTIVDSFHGMIFSIIFNKPFWIIGNKNRGITRFTSLLKVFNLENRLIEENSFDKINLHENIDWENVNALLEEKRNQCINVLYNALKE